MSYTDTFIRVAEDCPAQAGETPPPRVPPSVAELQHRLLSAAPYTLTEEDLYVRVYGLRRELDEDEITATWESLRAEVYAKPQACLRASPLTKRYGFGAHYDGEGRIGLHPVGSDGYARCTADDTLTQLAAMRSRRA